MGLYLLVPMPLGCVALKVYGAFWAERGKATPGIDMLTKRIALLGPQQTVRTQCLADRIWSRKSVFTFTV